MIICGVLLIFLLGVPAWGQGVVVDQAGREVVLPPRVERVVDLHGGATWVVYALGEAGLLVGAYFVSPPTDPLALAALGEVDPRYPEKALPILPGVETLLALKPDVVFASSVVHGHGYADLLAEFGIPTVLLYPETLELLEEAVELVGAVVGREGRAAALAGWIRDTVDLVASTAGQREPRPTVYFSAFYPLNIYAGEVIQNVLTELAGGLPLGKELSPWRAGAFWYRANAEQVILWDPEVVIVPSYSRSTLAEVAALDAFRSTRAARTGRLYRFPSFFGPWDTPSPEVALGLLWLAEVLHPGATGVDVVAAAARFYEEFFGCQVSPDDLGLRLGR